MQWNRFEQFIHRGSNGQSRLDRETCLKYCSISSVALELDTEEMYDNLKANSDDNVNSRNVSEAWMMCSIWILWCFPFSLSLSSIIHTSIIYRPGKRIPSNINAFCTLCLFSFFFLIRFLTQNRTTKQAHISLARAFAFFKNYQHTHAKPIISIFTELQCRWNQLILSLDELLAIPLGQTKHNLSLFLCSYAWAYLSSLAMYSSSTRQNHFLSF